MLTQNVVDNIIAGVVATALSTAVGLILQAFGINAQQSFTLALFVLLALIIIFFVVRGFYYTWLSLLASRLIQKAFAIKDDEANKGKIAFKTAIVQQIQPKSIQDEEEQEHLITLYPNQMACEPLIQEACRNATTIKILTIRGERYFYGGSPRSILRDILL